jgi:cell division protein FtsB
MAILEKTGFFLALVLMVVILFLIVFSENGIRDYEQLTLKKADVSSRIHITRQENTIIEKQILRLKQDINYIKHLARHEHGMAEPDELIFKQQK